MSKRPDKPTFINTKGDRNAEDGMLDTWNLDEHYRRIFAGLFSYEGLPEGCPAGFVEGQAVWHTGACGCTKAKGFGVMLTPAKASTRTPYGLPYQWTPEPVNGMHKVPGSDFFRERRDPILYTGAPMRELIEPYIQIMERTMRVLNINVFALSQPVMVAGVPGSELDGLLMQSSIMEGETYIPVTRAGAQAPVVLDLKAQDHTQNLISTIDWCDSRILEIMLSSNGMEKSSGVTTMETVSGVQSIIQEAEVMLEQRKAWCEECNAKYGLDMTVSYGKGMESLMAPPQPEKPVDDAEGSDDESRRLSIRARRMPEGGRSGEEGRTHGKEPSEDPIHDILRSRYRIRRTRNRDNMRCLKIHTPQTYFEEKGIDIWDEIFDGAAFDNAALMQEILEHYYRKWMIGSCDADDWIEAVKDRLWIVGGRWDGIMSALADADLSNVDVRAYERIVRRTAIEGTQGTVRTLSHEGDDVNTTENETLPQSPIDGRRYLDGKTTQTRSNGQVDTDTYNPNEQDRETYSEQADIAAATYRDMMAKWPRLEEDFAAEFRDYFVNRWSVCRPIQRRDSTPSRAPCPPGNIR